jgi:hypothetical protein
VARHRRGGRPAARAQSRALARAFALAASVLLTAGIAWRAQHDAAAVPALAVTTPATAPTQSQAQVPAARGAAAQGSMQGALAGDANRSRMITGTVVARESRAVTDEYQARCASSTARRAGRGRADAAGARQQRGADPSRDRGRSRFGVPARAAAPHLRDCA